MRPVEPSPPSAVRGVPLVQLAAVHAALAEGFELIAVLDMELLPQRAWFEAEVSWKARLVSETSEMDRYAAELARQQDRMRRRIEPLEEDVEAWIGFLRAYEMHADPFELLTGLGLGLNDMSRLGRRWSKRFDAQPKLAQKAAKLSLKLETRTQRGEKVRLPPITVAPAKLSPSPAAGTYRDAASAPAQATQSPGSAPVLGLDQYAALSADLRVADERDHAAVLARYGIDARHAVSLDEAWRARLSSDKELYADFRVLVGHYEQSASLRKRSAASLPKHHEVPTHAPAQPAANWGSSPAPSAWAPAAWPAPNAPAFSAAMSPVDAFLTPLPITAPPESLRLPPKGTAPGMVMAHVNVLPFKGSVRALPRVADKLPPLPPRRDGDIDATTDVIPALLDSEVMPFEKDEPEPEDNLDGTMMLGAISFDDDALPFAGTHTPPPLSDMSIVPGSLPLPLVGGSLDATGGFIISLSDSDVLPFEGSLDMTSGFVISISDDDVLPFSDSLDTTSTFVALSDDDALPFAATAPQPKPKPARPRDPLDSTTIVKAFDIVEDPSEADELDATTLFRALDLGLDDDPDDVVAPPAAPRSAPGAPPSALPQLSLDQLASLHAELAVAPHDAVAIRARYRLHDHAAQQRLEAYWEARFHTEPQEHAAYHHKFTEFRAWLLSSR